MCTAPPTAAVLSPDSNAPTWWNNLDGQVNLRDAVRRTISLATPQKEYRLRPEPELATLLVRPRGWHMEEKHMLVDGEPVRCRDTLRVLRGGGGRGVEKGKGGGGGWKRGAAASW